MSHVFCPDCGFQNPESAHFCSRCGASLAREEDGVDATMSMTADEVRAQTDIIDEAVANGPTLVVRAGGGRAGEFFTPTQERTTIGRSPDCDIFLDDVTVSRQHAVLVQEDGTVAIEDLGSLNGTFLNRRRIERSELENGDELQVGKYRLTFLAPK